MPGTIRITVQELVELKAPGGKKFAIQVSLAGTAEQTPLQGATPDPASPGLCSTKPYNTTFSFTSFSLKDFLDVSLIDARGVPVGITNLPVTSIVSKGSRDELLVLSNGGRIHIQSNFSLNEEEKARIAALKATTLAKRGSPSASPRRMNYAEWKAERQPGTPGRIGSATSARADADPLSIPEGAPLAVGIGKSSGSSAARGALSNLPNGASASASAASELRSEAEGGAQPEGASGEKEVGKKVSRGKGRILRKLFLTTLFVAGVVLLWPQRGPKGPDKNRSRAKSEDKDTDSDADNSRGPEGEKKRKTKKLDPLPKAEKATRAAPAERAPLEGEPGRASVDASAEGGLEPPASPRFRAIFGFQGPEGQSAKS